MSGHNPKSHSSIKRKSQLEHYFPRSKRSQQDHLRSQAIKEYAEKITIEAIELGTENCIYNSLGLGKVWRADQSEIDNFESFEKIAQSTYKDYKYYWAPLPGGGYQKRTSHGAKYVGETITFHPRQVDILQKLDALGIDISPIVENAIHEAAEAWNTSDRNSRVLSYLYHPNAGNLHGHFLTTKFDDPTLEVEHVTLVNKNTHQGNVRSAHLGICTIGVLRYHADGDWPMDLSKNAKRFLRDRAKASGFLPADYLVSRVLDRVVESRILELRKDPNLNEVIKAAEASHRTRIKKAARATRLRLELEQSQNKEEFLAEQLKKIDRSKAEKEENLRSREKELAELEAKEAKLGNLTHTNAALEDQIAAINDSNSKLSRDIEQATAEKKKQEAELSSITESSKDLEREREKIENDIDLNLGTIKRARASSAADLQDLQEELGMEVLERAKLVEEFDRFLHDTEPLTGKSHQILKDEEAKQTKSTDFEQLYFNMRNRLLALAKPYRLKMERWKEKIKEFRAKLDKKDGPEV